MMSPIKPWFIHRPKQMMLRLLRQFHRPDTAMVQLPWKLPLVICPRQAIGRAIWHTGLYDLAVTEVLYRLINPGAICVDVGANIGYLSGLMALRAGRNGHVTAFEPFEDNHRQLLQNLRLAEKAVESLSPITVHQMGLSSHDGEASLVFEDVGKDVDVGTNDGTAYVGVASESNRAVKIVVSRYDELITGMVDVMKIDVEGHEVEVFRGASDALQEHRIKHVVFEEHAGVHSSSYAFLEAAGYHIRRLSWTLSGLRLLKKEDPVPLRLEAPNFLATLEPQIFESLEQPGWRCLESA